MSFKEDLEARVAEILTEKWTTREVTVVPEAADVKLGNDAVELTGTVLYADLTESTNLVDGFQNWFAAEVYKVYLHCAAKIIASEGGSITAYDGDRIMAVYLGDSRNTSAVRTALKINWARENIVNAKLRVLFPKTDYSVRHTVGIDTSRLFVARTGIRGSNDLVWVGRAANYAAKLSSISSTRPTYITADVYNNIHESVKFSNKVDMWSPFAWTDMNNQVIYGSTYWWPL
jgi:class 3 adenylate cyclase